MRVLVTGAAGFIGSHALKLWHERHPDWRFFVVDKLSAVASLDRIAWARGDGRVQFFLHDLAAPLPERIAEMACDLDYVAHFAAETHVNDSLADPEPFLRSNVLGTFNLLEFCRLRQPRLRTFYYVSTDEVYGPAPDGTDHAEGAPHRPSNPYSATKAAAEDLCFAWEHSMGVPVVVTNTMNNLGEMQHPKKFVARVTRALLRGEIVTVHGTPDRPGSRKYLYARDHGDAIEHLMRIGRRGERYNVVGAEEVNNLEMVRRVECILGREARLRFVDFHATRPGHDFRYSLDGSKMAALGWTPPTPFGEALERTVLWTAEHQEWL